MSTTIPAERVFSATCHSTVDSIVSDLYADAMGEAVFGDDYLDELIDEAILLLSRPVTIVFDRNEAPFTVGLRGSAVTDWTASTR